MRPAGSPRHVVTRVLLPLLVVSLLVPVPATAAEDPLAGAPPATIRVCDGDGRFLAEVPFDRYVKTVLPREFPPDWPYELLEAGALAIKSYAWYHVRNPWRDGCDVSNTTRHQLYCPDCGNAPTPRSDRAVEATWHLRFDDAGRGDVAFAQYCSVSCDRFPEGRHLDQYAARDQAAAGWTAEQLIAHHYRAMPPRLVDWRAGIDLAFDGSGPYAFDEAEPLRLTAGTAGVPVDDPRVRARLSVTCELDGTSGTHVIDETGVITVDGRPTVVFDGASRVRGCAEDEVVLVGTLTVNGWTAVERAVQAWRPWTSASDRPVERVAPSDDPVQGAVALSRALFPDAGGSGRTASGLLGDLAALTADSPGEPATTAVVARSDRFADALAATALAGSAGPILFTPGGPDAPLDPAVGDELERILPAGSTVHVVGGTGAVSATAEDDLASRGYVVARHAGATRIETALAVADHLRTHGGDPATVLVARAYPDTSAGWADAVTAGAYAATQGHPILLTGTDRLDDRTEAWIEAAAERGEVDEAVLLGGVAAVPADAESRLDRVSVRRVAGSSRDATAVAVAEELWTRPAAPEVTAALVVDAYGDRDWPFALAAAVFSARVGAPQVVTHGLVPRATTGEWLDSSPGLPAYVVGGDGVVPPRIDEDVSGGS